MSHDHDHPPAGGRRLGVALALAASYMTAEVLGGLYTGSLALLAAAGHMLSDVAALALALFAMWLSDRNRPRTSGLTAPAPPRRVPIFDGKDWHVTREVDRGGGAGRA